jgi:hypothetical protein
MLWQKDWQESNKARFTFNLSPMVKITNRPKVNNRRNEVILNRLRTGVCNLPGHLPVINKENPNCAQCGVVYDIEHYLLRCPLQQVARNKLLMRLRNIKKCSIDLKSVLSPTTNREVDILIDFIKETHKYYTI